MRIKQFLVALSAVSATLLVSTAQTAQASEDGCKALLCFAGGRNVDECQSTINSVLRDLAKGKPFPHCQLAGGTNENPISVQTRKKRGKVKSVTINISEKYASNPADRKQTYNF